MSEQEHERPLTRRELRLREQAESAGAESIDEAVASDAGVADRQPAATDAAQSADIEVEIDPLNPDGTPRTRREMRELRAAAVAEILAEREAAAEQDSPAPVVGGQLADPVPAGARQEAGDIGDDSYGAPTEALSFEDLPVNGDVTPASSIELDAPTEAFTLEDILDAAEPTAPTGDAEAVAQLFAGDDDTDGPAAGDTAAAEEVVEVVEVDVTDADVTDVAEVHEVDEELLADDLAASAIAPDSDDAGSDAAVEADFVVDAAGRAVEGEDIAARLESDAEAAAAEQAELDADEEDTSRDTAGYSFPDIKPPEEWRSVFDDPSRAANITAPGDSGDFDDLISRAVAQEGSTGGTGASALILPSHPGDTGGLTGPLGSTGELFVTGSIELPKSMGETGGHSGIHDSIDFDPFLTGESTETIASAAESGPMPVSALSAVSARRRPEVPVVAEPTKDRSKMPLILALSGGGLIILVIGGVIFAATQGLFG